MVQKSKPQIRSRALSFFIKKVLVLCGTLLSISIIYANPVGGEVTSGSATITQTGTHTEITQTSDKAIINWQSFNIGANESTHFQQPNSNSITLNRINPDQGASQIFGQLSSNGRLILVNQAGIFFGSGARVDVGSIIASTSGISDQNFLAGKLIFDQVSAQHGAIINQGTIVAANNGLVALIGSNVSNEGVIQANSGHIVLASGNKFTVDLAGDGLINFAIDEASTGSGTDQNGNTMRDGVKNSGALIADGGKILLTARDAQGVVDKVINMTGVAQARSVSQKNGEIILSGNEQGTVDVSGATLDVSGKNTGEKAGTIKILGSKITVQNNTLLDASGLAGGGTILIGGNYLGKGPEQNALSTLINSGVMINANALLNGDGGKVIVWSDGQTGFHGNITAQGGVISGNGGFVETSGAHLNITNGTVNTIALNGTTGTWLLDPTNIYIANDLSNALAAGMIGSDTSADTNNAGTFQGSGSIDDSLLTVSNLINALELSNIIVTTTNPSGAGSGNITVVDPLSWTSTYGLTLNAANKIFLNANITATNGSLTLSAANVAQSITSGTAASPSATGVTANINVKNFTLSQGNWFQSNASLPTFNVSNNFAIAAGSVYPTASARFNGSFLRVTGGDGSSGTPYQIADIFGLQGIATQALTNSYSQVANIDATVTANWSGSLSGISGFVPIGSGEYNSTTGFSGSYNGNNYTISNLTINGGNNNDIGLFGSVNGVSSVSRASVSNLILNNITVTGAHNVGGLVGNAVNADFNNILVHGTVSSTGSGIGLLAGWFDTGIMSIVGTSGSVTTAAGQTGQGGLIGNGGGTISNVYSTASVTGGNGSYSGGLMGRIALGTLTGAYSTGAVTPSSGTGGGLIGMYFGGSVTNSYWDSQTSGRNTSAAGTSRTTAQLQSALQTGFSGATWGLIAGDATSANGSYPYLLTFNASAPRVISGFAPGGSSGATGLGGTAVNLAYNGANISTTYTGANGFYYYLVGNGVIADNTAFLTYLNSGATKANVIGLAPASGASAVLLNMTSNAINIYGNNATNTTNTLLSTALGSLNSTNILYSASGANLTLGNATNTTANLVTLTSTRNAAGTITSGIATNYTLDGTIATTGGGTSSLTFAGPVDINTTSITTSGLQNYQGNVTLGAAATLTGSAITLGTSSSNTLVNGGNTLTIDHSGTSQINSVVSGSGGLTKSGIGTLTLVTANTLSGGITVNGGILSFMSASAGGNTSGITVNSGATLHLGGVALSSIPMTFNSNSTLLATGTASLSSDIALPTNFTITDTGTLTLSGILSGANGFTKSGIGTVELSGSNTYSGLTTVSNGILRITNSNGLGSTASGTAVASGSTLEINNATIGAEALSINGVGYSSGGAISGVGTSSYAGNITLDGASSIVTTGNLTLSGIIDSSSSYTLTKLGAGNVTLSGTNTYTGTTSIQEGTLVAANANALGSTSAGTSVSNGAVLEINNTNIGAEALTLNGTGIGLTGAINGVGTSSYAGNINLASSSYIGSTGDLTLSGIISSGGVFSLTKRGTGNVTLSGTNTYTGSTAIQVGTLTAANASALGATSAGTSISSGATLNINNVNIGAENITSLIGAITGTGTASLAGNITISSAGNREIGGTGTLTLSGIIGSTAARVLTKTGTGTVILSGVNTYTGTTNINAGILSINADSGLGAAPGSATPGSIGFGGGTLQTTSSFTLNANRGILLNTGGGTILTDPSTTLTYNGIINGANALTKAGTGILSLGGSNTNSGTTTISAGTLSLASVDALGSTTSTTVSNGAALDIAFNSGTLTNTNAINLNGSGISSAGALTFTGTSDILSNAITLQSDSTLGGTGSGTLSGIVSGAFGLTKAGSGTITLGGINTYTGATNLNAGTLVISADSGLGAAPGTVTSGHLVFNGGTLQNTASFTLNANRGITLNIDNGTFFTDPATTLTYNGIIQGVGGLIKQGAGTLVLGGSDTYQGGTFVLNGILSRYVAPVVPQNNTNNGATSQSVQERNANINPPITNIITSANISTNTLTTTPNNLVISNVLLATSNNLSITIDQNLQQNIGPLTFPSVMSSSNTTQPLSSLASLTSATQKIVANNGPGSNAALSSLTINTNSITTFIRQHNYIKTTHIINDNVTKPFINPLTHYSLDVISKNKLNEGRFNLPSIQLRDSNTQEMVPSIYIHDNDFFSIKKFSGKKVFGMSEIKSN